MWGKCVPPAEICNGQDDDCNGQTDEGGVCGGTPCTPGQQTSCVTGCGSVGSTTCGPSHQWGNCVPPVETCGNNKDDNCNGLVDEQCGPNAQGIEVTYRFTYPAASGSPSGLAIYDEADDGNNTPLPRPVPFGPTEFDTHYAWGIATDVANAGCSVVNANLLECTVHRPAGSRMWANVHIEFTDQPALWACATLQGPTNGTFEVYVAGQPASYVKLAPGCRFFFTLP
jgi:hypothetical protein